MKWTVRQEPADLKLNRNMGTRQARTRGFGSGKPEMLRDVDEVHLLQGEEETTTAIDNNQDR
jgi:hypothetical protein